MKTKLWFVGKETEKARLYSRLPSSRRPGHEDQIWIPISQIEHAQRWPLEQGEEWPAHILTVTDWFGREKNL
jgi:hypothetical protein